LQCEACLYIFTQLKLTFVFKFSGEDDEDDKEEEEEEPPAKRTRTAAAAHAILSAKAPASSGAKRFLGKLP